MTVLQFILFLYHNQPDFAAQCASPEFLCALAATLFTYKTPSEGNSDAGTPVEEIKVRDPLFPPPPTPLRPLSHSLAVGFS